MTMERPRVELMPTVEEHEQLRSMARSRSLPAALGLRAKFVLACAAGVPDSGAAQRFGTTNATAGKWHSCLLDRRISGLYGELCPGKPRSISNERKAELINKTFHTKPADGATHRGVRSMGAQTGISPTGVHRYPKLFDLQPHRTRPYKLSSLANAFPGRPQRFGNAAAFQYPSGSV